MIGKGWRVRDRQHINLSEGWFSWRRPDADYGYFRVECYFRRDEQPDILVSFALSLTSGDSWTVCKRPDLTTFLVNQGARIRVKTPYKRGTILTLNTVELGTVNQTRLILHMDRLGVQHLRDAIDEVDGILQDWIEGFIVERLSIRPSDADISVLL